MAVGKEEFVEIVKPRSDKREYRRVVLKNSLQVLLISDPDTDKCAASMNVSVGSYLDPEGLEGLAHFLEHMLFYASKKYPEEDSYMKFISEHGGSTNAFTASERTNYFFDVNVDGFEEALDRFAQFFIKPLMSPDATMREIKAVDSENQKNLLSDTWRMHQLQKHLSNKGHPFHKFSTGNWETLEVLPRAKGLDTRDELIKFYEDHYSSNLMHLVIYAKDDLNKLHALVDEKFQDIQNTDRNQVLFPGQPCGSEHLQILVKSVPIKEGHKLKVTWPIIPEIRHYKEGPCRYLGHLIGHEGEGSLFHVLKTLGWASGLYAGESDWSMEYAFFKVGIDLTDAGHEHMQDIVGLLFKYISLLQMSGVCEWIFQELSSICETKFHYQDKIAPIDYVVHISSNMEIYPPEDWIVGSSLPCQFNAQIIRKVLDKLTPDNVRIFWESKNFQGSTDMVEPWYGTAFSVEKISLSKIKEWMASSPNEDLHLPEPNIFIPTDLSLKNAEDKILHPVLLRKSPYSNLWFKPDTTFSTPKAYLKIDFSCPYASESSEAEVMTDLFTRLLMDCLNEYAYHAQVAGLHYGVNHTNTGLQVTIVGYNHKLKILLETVIAKIAKFEVRPDRFDVIQEVVLKDYQNMKFQQPYHQAMYYCSLMLQENTWPWTEQLEVLPHILSEDLSRFIPTMLSRTFLECYVAGNIERGEAELMVKQIETILFEGQPPICRPLYPSQHLSSRVVKLQTGANYLFSTEGLNPNDENSALVHYIQVHQDDFLMNVKLQLFALTAKQPAFHQLRSVEQLGYITVLMQRNDFGVRGLQFIIQSSVKGPGHIDSRVEEFLKMFESKLYEMTNEEFDNNVNALIDMKLEKHKNLREESQFYWREISDGTLKFDRRESEVSMLRQLKKQDLLAFFDEYVKVGGPKKRMLSVRVFGNKHLSDYEAEKNQAQDLSCVRISDIFAFRRSQPLFGSLKGVNGWMKL
ncbi:hypothetical protein MLD38_031029 [Melastoma candidum]|uniref:Uncharacterized protein n=1 Tax=Melastoma candidum TaxID=119954 RepID=A0ACB9MMV3_9MYRT|nr:hypothetical protein MLD38_031029 [Melastoma candidum]